MSNKKISSKDKALFRSAMAGVKPLEPKNKVENKEIPPPSNTPSRPKRDNSLDEPINIEPPLSDFIPEPIFDTTILSYQKYPLPTKRFKQLKQGNIPCQGKLDLHGYRSDEAKLKLLDYLKVAKQQEKRCILIIHGKGSYNGEPPRIKNLINVWLAQIPDVIAFHSAIPKDGGTGAVYVLLKR